MPYFNAILTLLLLLFVCLYNNHANKKSLFPFQIEIETGAETEDKWNLGKEW